MLQQDVLVEVLLSDHAPLADLALVLWLEMCPLLVHVQGIAVRASLPADVADYRSFFVLETNMQSHVSLYLELLPAIFAVVLVLRRVFPLQMLFQSTSILAFELAHVARILFRLGSVPVAVSSPSYTFRRMLSANMRVEGGLVGAFVVAKVASVGQALRVLHLLFLFGFVLQRHVHLKRDQATAYLEADFTLVTLSLLVDRVSVPFQHLHYREADVALLASVYFGVVVMLLVRGRNFLDVLFLYLDRAHVAVTDVVFGRDHENFVRVFAVLQNIVGRLSDRFLALRELWRLICWKEGIVEATLNVDYLPWLHRNRFLAVYKTSVPVLNPEKYRTVS